MATFRNESNGTWYTMFRYTDWKGERKQKCKRGFATKRDALNWKQEFLRRCPFSRKRKEKEAQKRAINEGKRKKSDSEH